MKKFLVIVSACMLTLIVGIMSAQDEVTTVTLLTHDSFSVSEDLLLEFEEENNIRVEILRAGDAGQVVNQSILSKNNPLGDVLFGVDNTFLSRALSAEIFEPYESPLLESVDEGFYVENGIVTPMDYGDVCLNYDIAYFEEQELALPESLADLTLPEYEDMLVVQNPATSSPGLAFLLATIDEFGTEGDYTYLDYWTDLVENGVLITDGWSDAFYGQFTATTEDGTYPMVVSYASSPPVTIDEETNTPLIDSIVADNTCFRQIEYAGILQGTEEPEAAQKLIDFMLSKEFQDEIPLQMYVFPVNTEAELPEMFAEFANIPENPVVMDPVVIDENRQDWIEAWTETVTR